MANKFEDDFLSQFGSTKPDSAPTVRHWSYDEGGTVEDDEVVTGAVPEAPPQTMTEDQARQSGFVSEDEARQQGFVGEDELDGKQAYKPQAHMSEDEARQAGFITEEEASKAGFVDLPESSAAGSFFRAAKRGAAPAIGAIPAMGAGFTAGAAIGALGGPAAPVTVPVGGLLGAAAGGLGAGYLISKAQDWIGEKLGLTDEPQFQADIEKHPYAEFAGGLAPNLAAFSPGKIAGSLAGRGLSSVAMSGLEAGTELATEGHVDPVKVGMAGAFGAVSYAPTRLGQAGLNLGEAAVPARFRPGRPDEAQSPTRDAEKAAVLPTVPLTVAAGVAHTPPPPPKNTNIGNEQSAAVPSARTYPKENAPEAAGAEMLSGIPEEQRLALSESIERNRFKDQPVETAPTEELPMQTGIAEAAPRPPDAKPDVAPAPTPEGGITPDSVLNELKARGPDAKVIPEEHPQLPGVTIERTQETPKLVSSSEDGRVINIDPRVPKELQVNEKMIDPSLSLSIHEMYRRGGEEYIRSEIAAGRMKPMDDAAIANLARKEAGIPAERAYLEEHHGFNEADWHRYQQVMGELTQGAPAKAVTATVTQPKVVKEAITRAKAEGMNKIAKALENAPPERAGQMARRFLEGMTNASGEVKTGDYATTRIPSKPATVEGLGVTARTKADAERKGNSITAVKEAFNKFAPPNDKIPTSKEEIAALKKRLSDAMVHAERKLGSDPLAYKPQVKPPEWMWMRQARALVTSRMSPKQIGEFIANEKQLRSGRAEDAANVRETGRIESDIAMNRRGTGEAAERVFDVPHEETEPYVQPKPVKPEDLQLPPKTQELEIAKMTPEDLGRVSSDMDKIAENLIAESEKVAKGKDWKAEEAKRTESDAEKTARLKAARLNKQSIKSEIKVEPTQAAHDAGQAAVAAEKGANPKPAENPADIPSDLMKHFLNNESGAFNLARANNIYKAKKQAILTGMNKWLRNTWGVPLSNKEFAADSIFGQKAATQNELNTLIVKALDDDWMMFTKVASQKDGLAYLHTLETHPASNRTAFEAELVRRGVDAQNADWMSHRAPIWRAMLDKAYATEKQFGSIAEYVSNYVPHIFKDVAGAQNFINSRIKQLGPTWFQKNRSFDLIEQAMRAGFELKYKNPADLITHRLMASEDMKLKVGTLHKLEDIQTAYQTQNLTAKQAARTRHWTKVNAPDHSEWRISPEITPLWNNAIEAKGLWSREDTLGSAFRGWMKLKNVWVPVKLAISAFHPLHVVANVNIAENIARGLSEPGFMGKVKGVGEGLKLSLTDPLFSLPLEKLPLVGQHLQSGAIGQYSGKWMRQAKAKEEHLRTADEKLWAGLYNEGGVSPQMSEQLRISAKRDLTLALAELKAGNGAFKGVEIPRVVFHGLRRTVEHMQGWMFEEMIPNLKAAQYMRSVEQLLRNDPSLIHDGVSRRVALRAIGKSIDNRFGEMFYGSLFWNRTLKDASIGSMLSLGWNLGQVREGGGVITNLALRTGGRGNRMQKLVYDSTNKGAYVSSYVGLSMMTAGAISYAMSGNLPTGLDYTFPRAGGNNPDGSPRRMSTMFNTREVPMLTSHIQEQNSVLGGLMSMLWNKMILTPITDAISNKDFFGNQLYDPDAPWYMKALQLIDSEMGATFNPIAVSGHQRVREQGGGKVDVAMSYAGFGPAPAYISRSAIQNRITHAFGKYGPGASTRPYEESGTGLVQGAYRYATDNPTQATARREARGELNRASQQDDADAAGQARQKLIKSGMSPATVAKLRPGESDVYMFSRLPVDVQKNLAREMDQDEFMKYVNRNKQLNGRAKVEIIRERGVNR